MNHGVRMLLDSVPGNVSHVALLAELEGIEGVEEVRVCVCMCMCMCMCGPCGACDVMCCWMLACCGGACVHVHVHVGRVM